MEAFSLEITVDALTSDLIQTQESKEKLQLELSYSVVTL